MVITNIGNLSPRTIIVEPKTGLLTRDGFALFQSLQNAISGIVNSIETWLVAPQEVSNVVTSYYVASVGVRAEIFHATAYNDSAVQQTITLYLVPAGSSAGPTTTIVSNRIIESKGTTIIGEMNNHVIEPLGGIFAVASAAVGINLTVSGSEST